MANDVTFPLTGAGDTTAKAKTRDTGARGHVQVIDANAPDSAQSESLTSANLAAGSSVDLTTADITTSTTGHLAGIDVGASVAIKVIVQTVIGAGRTTQTILFAHAGESKEWRPPHQDYITHTGGSTRGFGVNITNLDPTQPADVYATVMWDEQ